MTGLKEKVAAASRRVKELHTEYSQKFMESQEPQSPEEPRALIEAIRRAETEFETLAKEFEASREAKR